MTNKSDVFSSRVVYKIVYPEDIRDEDPESVTGLEPFSI